MTIIQRSNNTGRVNMTIRIVCMLIIVCSFWVILTKKDYYRMSIAELTIYAQKNDVMAQLQLGYNYQQARGVAQDLDKALELYQKAAAQGNFHAMYNLGVLYSENNYSKRDLDKSIEWYQRALAVNPNDPSSMYNLGWTYMHKKEYEKAMEWYTKAAEKGEYAAQTAMAWMYDNRLGVQQNKLESFMLNLRAAKNGDSYAMYNLAGAYLFGEGTGKNVAKAIEWYQKAAEAGNAEAQGYLGYIYTEGKVQGYVVGKDYGKALQYVNKAVAQNDALGQYVLGWMYHYGQGVSKDYMKAMTLYQKAAEQNQAHAINQIGYMYECGQGIKADKTQAIKWYKRAADLGLKDAKNNLNRLQKQ